MGRGLVVLLTAWMALTAAADAKLRIKTLSNRADLVSGGDVLVRVSGARTSKLKVRLNGRPVTKLLRPGHRSRSGLLTGLRNGRNRVTARAGRRGARLRVVNHPLGGPVFAGPQTQPWICRNEEFGLNPPVDEQCNAPPVVAFTYKDALTGQMAPYDPGSPPPDSAIASTRDGAPWIVRTERGVMNRNTYQLQVLRDGWNRDVYWTFGGDCTPRHTMADTPPATVAVAAPNADRIIERGYVAGFSANTDLGSRCDSVVNAETLMMLKEHIAETLGPIRRTVSEGCSGGSMQQNWISSNYPGLLDAVQVQCTYTDIWNTMQQAEDCHLLDRVFDADPLRWNIDKQAAVAGYQGITTCRSLWDLQGELPDPVPPFYSRNWLDPDNYAGCLGGPLGGGAFASQPDWTYDPQTNPGGARCTLPDYMVSVFGRRPDGFANRPYDNVGVQYGLVALRKRRIAPEDFVRVNERVGGLDIDWNRTPQRSVADLTALRVAYRAGLVTNPRAQQRIPMFDVRGSSNLEIHTDFNSYVLRARQIKAYGNHANSVLWTTPLPLTTDSTVINRVLGVLEQWLDAIAADRAPGTRAEKVVRNKPAEAVDACFIGGEKITDLAECNKRIPYYADPRITAGGPWTDDVLKCRLRPLDRADYAGTGLTDEQFARLQAAFADGVCDYTKPAVAERPSVPWLSFAAGPGGRPLGRPPASRPYRRR